MVGPPMFVKICGITTAPDALQALGAGADAVGLILTESPRRIDPSTAAEIVNALPPDALSVAVFRRETPERIIEAVRATGVRGAQVHGASPAELRALRSALPFLVEAVPGGDGAAGRLDESEADLVLVDSAAPGSGRGFDWSVLEGASRRRLVLAGGLTPENVGRAVGSVRPFGVDVASGVEAAPGRKDHHRVRLFIARAHEAAARWEEGGDA